MRWLRHPLARTAALAAAVSLVITRAAEMDGWFWAGLVLAVLNVIGLVGESRSRRRADPPAPPPRPMGGTGDVDVRLADLLADPAVASAWGTAPEQWQQVAHLDAPGSLIGAVAASELAELVWLSHEGEEWHIGLGGEVEPYVDLDADEAFDPVLRILRAHPAVADAWHEDREVYVVQPRYEIALDRFARLAALALATAQVEAAARRP